MAILPSPVHKRALVQARVTVVDLGKIQQGSYLAIARVKFRRRSNTFPFGGKRHVGSRIVDIAVSMEDYSDVLDGLGCAKAGALAENVKNQEAISGSGRK